MNHAVNIRVLLADDHPMLNRGLSRAIAETEGMDLVASAFDGESALDLIREHQPDVAVLDIDMPKMTGLDVLAAVVDEGMPTRVIMLTGSVQDDFVYAAITAGAMGYIIKTMDWPGIMDSIRKVAHGETVVDPSMANTLAGALQRRRAQADSSLNSRESLVLSLTAQSHTAKEIAARMNVGDRMVKKHLSAIYRKLGVTSKQEAVAEAIRRGLVK